MIRFVLVFLATLGCTEYDLKSDVDKNDKNDTGTDTETDTDGDTDPVDGAGNIRGRICSPAENTWVVGADVWVETSSGTISAVTDSDGYFLLENVPAGTHTVYVQKGSFSTSFEVVVVDGELTELAEEECLDGDIAIAVITGNYDHIESILDTMSLDYDLYEGETSSQAINFLRDPAAMADYDIIFADCGDSDAWSNYRNEIATNIKQFVTNGGSFYASDWRYYLIEAAFPDMVTFIGNDSVLGSARLGVDGQYTAEVLDSHMASRLGSSTAQINYDLAIWAVADRKENGVPLVRGTIDHYTDDWYLSTTSHSSPLAIRGEYGTGAALYTSFHNEAQITGDMAIMLEEMVLSL